MRTKNKNEGWPDFWPGNLTKDQAEEHGDEPTRDVENDDTFHIGQCYENEAAKLQECIVCGGREFNVGVGNYYTAIRCKKCEWETCIHSG